MGFLLKSDCSDSLKGGAKHGRWGTKRGRTCNTGSNPGFLWDEGGNSYCAGRGAYYRGGRIESLCILKEDCSAKKPALHKTKGF